MTEIQEYTLLPDLRQTSSWMIPTIKTLTEWKELPEESRLAA